MFSKIFGLAFAVAVIIILPLLASSTHTTGKVEDRSFTGKIVCVGCEFDGAEGARADCNTYGHNRVLKTRDGRYVHLLENRYSRDLMDGQSFRDREVVLNGRFFPAAGLLDVRSFKADGREYSWCLGCRAMDACASTTN